MYPDTEKSALICLSLCHWQWDLRRGPPFGNRARLDRCASSSKNKKRRKFADKWRAAFESESLAPCAFSRTFTRQKHWATGCPVALATKIRRASSLPRSSLRPADLDEFRGSLILFSNRRATRSGASSEEERVLHFRIILLALAPSHSRKLSVDYPVKIFLIHY